MSRVASKIEPVGINRDLPAHQTPPDEWTNGINMGMRDGIPRRIAGYEDVFGDPLAPPVYLQPTLTPSVAFWMYGTNNGAGVRTLAVTDGVNHDDITPVGGITTDSAPNAWSGGVLNGVPVVNAFNAQPMFWDLIPANPAVILPGWDPGAVAGSLRPFKNFLIAMDYTDPLSNRVPELVKWSDSADPGFIPDEWLATAGNDAGELSAAATPGAVVDGAQLRNQFLIVKANSTYSLDFVGGQFVFGLRKLFVTTGAISRNCMAEFQGKLVFFADGDITITDGHVVKSLVDRRMRRFIFSQISPSFFENSFIVPYLQQKEIWCCFPTGSSEYADTAAVWDYETDKWSIRGLFDTPHGAQGVVPDASITIATWDTALGSWDTYGGQWNQTNFNPVALSLVLADPVTGFIGVDAGNVNVDGSPILGSLNRDSLDFGAPLDVKTVRSVWPRILGTAGDVILVRVGSQMNVEDPITFGAALAFVIEQDVKIDAFATGRYLSFHFSGLTGNAWQMTGFNVEFGATGSLY